MIRIAKIIVNTLRFFPKLKKFPHVRGRIILFLDLLLILFAYFITNFIYTELTSISIDSKDLYTKGVICLVINGLFFFVFKTYSGLLRYSTFKDALRIWFTLFCSNLVLAVIYYIFYQKFLTTLAIFFINFLLSFIFVFSFRMVVRLIFDYTRLNNKSELIPMLVYGVEPSNISLAKMIVTDDNSIYQIVGFISPSAEISRQKIIGKPVYYKDVFYSNILEFNYIKAILIQPEEINRIEKQLLAEICYQNKIELMAVPSLQNWKTDGKDIKNINSFNIEDLLGRTPIEVDIEAIQKNLEGKRVLVTGAAGSIGSEIVRQLCQFNLDLLILFDTAETPLHQLGLNLKESFPNVKFVSIIADVRNKSKLESVFSTYKPQSVYHAAAYKHVPLMEDYPDEAIQTNVSGSKNVADLSMTYGVENFVMISTDKAVNPSSVMGASKRIAEIYIQALSSHSPTRFITTRFGNVLGSNGSVVPLFEKQIKKGGPVTVTDPDIIRYFMTIPEACSLVLEAGNFGKGGEIFIFDMGEPVKIKDMAEEMIRLSGLKPYEDINIIFTGLRPGEKLFEELLYDEENHTPTHNKKIMIRNVRKQSIEEVLPLLNQLIEASYTCNKMEIVKLMKQIVPEFKSINSEFKVLDNH